MYITKIDRYSERNNPNVTVALFDDSYSMTPLRNSGVLDGAAKEIMLPALRGACEEHQELLRVSVGAFSDNKIIPLTRRPGFFSVSELGRELVIEKILGGPGLNGNTALYRSIISGIRYCESAAKTVLARMNCRYVTANVVILTDGENTEQDATTRYVRDVIHSVDRRCIDLRVSLAYFKTSGRISRERFIQIAKECGLDERDCHFWADHGNSLYELQRAFRRLIDILSNKGMRKTMRSR